jgi:hypothetical protein
MEFPSRSRSVDSCNLPARSANRSTSAKFATHLAAGYSSALPPLSLRSGSLSFPASPMFSPKNELKGLEEKQIQRTLQEIPDNLMQAP